MYKNNLFRRYALIAPLMLAFLNKKRIQLQEKVSETQAVPPDPVSEPEVTIG